MKPRSSLKLDRAQVTRIKHFLHPPRMLHTFRNGESEQQHNPCPAEIHSIPLQFRAATPSRPASPRPDEPRRGLTRPPRQRLVGSHWPPCGGGEDACPPRAGPIGRAYETCAIWQGRQRKAGAGRQQWKIAGSQRRGGGHRRRRALSARAGAAGQDQARIPARGARDAPESGPACARSAILSRSGSITPTTPPSRACRFPRSR